MPACRDSTGTDVIMLFSSLLRYLSAFRYKELPDLPLRLALPGIVEDFLKSLWAVMLQRNFQMMVDSIGQSSNYKCPKRQLRSLGSLPVPCKLPPKYCV